MWLVLNDVFVQGGPELGENRAIKMTFRARQRQHIHTPSRDIRIEFLLVVCDVEGREMHENVRRVAVPAPTFELPRWTLKQDLTSIANTVELTERRGRNSMTIIGRVL
jgi:hypothetical protein